MVNIRRYNSKCKQISWVIIRNYPSFFDKRDWTTLANIRNYPIFFDKGDWTTLANIRNYPSFFDKGEHQLILSILS
jgi:hypothetical protein